MEQHYGLTAEMVGYYIHPPAQPVAEEHHVLLVASYQR